MYRLIMVGGGHAQLSVLKALAQNASSHIDAVLITPDTYQIYSGMLPGWMAGHYTLSECLINLRPLAEAAGVRLIFSKVVGIDAKRRRVELIDGTYLDYDGLSLDVGSEGDTSWLEAAGECLLPVKPLGNFVQRWPAILTAASQQDDYRLVVVGGGAAGVELVFAAQHAIAARRCKKASVMLVVSENGILPGHAAGVKAHTRALLQQRGVTLYQGRAVGITAGVALSSGESLHADCLIAATGARAPAWLRNTDLALDEQGYVLVDAQHRSLSHPNVFAAGDVCARADIKLVRSGVHAVFAGPVLARNLIASISGQKLRSYRPRKMSLYLLATGPQHAIASWGEFSAQGYWMWRWKNWIDRQFMFKYGALNCGNKE
ncbi:FAD-dependent oxidoreductase [Gallionella capsiferriformans]|uniref:Pyridine nucleotide-disulfide oxidoreductase family protein n=1 Tax=Gallionella capsiferriformans (strain ES-2) TaxID=395494 RepID=D9SHD7_GALCS|nr:FAD-dependent oxidoreductase [Gallionella capsiferriformans]ADL55934.1 pyridine nucleotide-disulfide oxidoreductase family protein [Gallionella capsiferriformans ES-2]